MQIIKCDICEKEIIREDAKSVHVGIGNVFSDHVEICADCGAPVLKLLKDNNLLKNDIKAELNKKVDVFSHKDLEFRVEKLEEKFT